METKELTRSGRSATVVANARAAEARRRALANTFRTALQADLTARGVVLGVGHDALIDAAVSCYVEIQELSNLFLRAKASADVMQRLGLARGQLARTLRQLGIVAALPEDETPASPGATPQDARTAATNYVAARAAEVEENL